MKDGSLFDYALLGDGFSHVAYGQVCGGESHSQRSVHKYHQRLVAFAHAVFDILGVSGEVEEVALDVVFVDGSSLQFQNGILVGGQVSDLVTMS